MPADIFGKTPPPFTQLDDITPFSPEDDELANISDTETVSTGDVAIFDDTILLSDELVTPSAVQTSAQLGGAFGKMETAMIGKGKYSRNDLQGGRSFINPLAIFHHASCSTANQFFDVEGSKGAFPKAYKDGTGNRVLTLESLLRDFPSNAKKDSTTYSTPYRLADFLFCKYYGRIPLNNLITLRRFAHPTYDNLQWGSFKVEGEGTSSPSASGGQRFNYRPIAQAVTYFGESTGNDLEKITSIKGEIKYKQLTAEVNLNEMNESNGIRGAESSPFANSSLFGSPSVATIAKGVSILTGGGDLGRRQAVDDGNRTALWEAHWANRTYGPVDSIVETQIRDRGIAATYKVELYFEYGLRSIGNINPRIAMMDIIANMLALTFNNAKFWGGANIFFPNHPQFAFLGNQNDFYSGRYGKYLDSVFSDLGSAFGKGVDIIKSLATSILNLDFKSAIKQIAATVGGAALEMQSAKNRPSTMAVKSLISGQPIGNWHLTIGNPYRPMMKMGNMIVKEWEMNFDGFLGADDFPTEMKYKIVLETSRPVDKAGVESWINGVMEQRGDSLGSGRMYYPSRTMIEQISTKYGAGNLKVYDQKNDTVVGSKDIAVNTLGSGDIGTDQDDIIQAVQAQGSLF
jgi:hypothetical protein